MKWLRYKEVSTVKVFWRNHLVDGSMWEAEADIKHASLIFSAHEVRLTSLMFKFPYFHYSLLLMLDYV